MENIYYVYPQVDPKVAFPRKAQPKVSLLQYLIFITHIFMFITDFVLFKSFCSVENIC